MDKVAIFLRVPVLQASYEILIPVDMKIRQVIALIIDLLEDLSAGQYAASATELLCRSDTGGVLDMECALCDYCVRHGEELVLL